MKNNVEICESIPSPSIPLKNKSIDLKNSLWSTDGKSYYAVQSVCEKLPPQIYELLYNNGTLYFSKIERKNEDILKLPDSASQEAVNEIQKFWEREEIFKKYDLQYKRGILLHGPPVSGKSCTIHLIVNDVIQRGGIVIKFNHPQLFADGMKTLRLIEPETPVVVVMEDIDSIISQHSESEVLNILDGIYYVHKTVFIATSNYPELLGERITNRPSRFDKRIFVDCPTFQARKAYIEHLLKDKAKEYDINKWVKDTNDFQMSHIKELFISVVVFGNPYKNSLEHLKEMNENKLQSKQIKMGFEHG